MTSIILKLHVQSMKCLLKDWKMKIEKKHAVYATVLSQKTQLFTNAKKSHEYLKLFSDDELYQIFSRTKGICHKCTNLIQLEKFMSGKPVAEQEIGQALLQEVVAFAETSISRRKFIVNICNVNKVNCHIAKTTSMCSQAFCLCF